MPAVPIFSTHPRPPCLILKTPQMASSVLQYHMEPWQTKDRILALQTLGDCISGLQLDVAGGAKWEALMDSGVSYALVYVLLDNFFCGFGKEELAACASASEVEHYKAEVMPYVAVAMFTLRDYLGFAFKYCTTVVGTTSEMCRKTLQNADVVLRELPHLWHILWEARTPFLDSQPPGIGVGNPDDILTPRSLHNGIATLVQLSLVFDQRFRTTLTKSREPTKMAHVALTVWVHCYSKPDRTAALYSARSAIDKYKIELGESRFEVFYQEAVHETTSFEQIAQAAMRDLKARNDVDKTISAVLEVVHNMCPSENDTYLWYPMGTTHQRRLLYACIAACQSLICMSKDANLQSCEVPFNRMFFMFAASVRRPDRFSGLSESFVHRIIALVSMFLLQAIEQGNKRFIEETTEIIQLCSGLLRRPLQEKDGSSDPPYPNALLRKASRLEWHSIANQLRMRGVHQQTQWKSLHQTWTVLGRTLQADKQSMAPLDADDFRFSFPLFTRCNWRGCLCSVHKPVHKLQACRGCSSVVYCNEMCQTRDWKEGGHREHCARQPSEKSKCVNTDAPSQVPRTSRAFSVFMD